MSTINRTYNDDLEYLSVVKTDMCNYRWIDQFNKMLTSSRNCETLTIHYSLPDFGLEKSKAYALDDIDDYTSLIVDYTSLALAYCHSAHMNRFDVEGDIVAEYRTRIQRLLQWTDNWSVYIGSESHHMFDFPLTNKTLNDLIDFLTMRVVSVSYEPSPHTHNEEISENAAIDLFGILRPNAVVMLVGLDESLETIETHVDTAWSKWMSSDDSIFTEIPLVHNPADSICKLYDAFKPYSSYLHVVVAKDGKMQYFLNANN